MPPPTLNPTLPSSSLPLGLSARLSSAPSIGIIFTVATDACCCLWGSRRDLVRAVLEVSLDKVVCHLLPGQLGTQCLWAGTLLHKDARSLFASAQTLDTELKQRVPENLTLLRAAGAFYKTLLAGSEKECDLRQLNMSGRKRYPLQEEASCAVFWLLYFPSHCLGCISFLLSVPDLACTFSFVLYICWDTWKALLCCCGC